MSRLPRASPKLPPGAASGSPRRRHRHHDYGYPPERNRFEFEVGGKTVRIGAIAKGSGMSHPNMATMLLFMTTDAKVEPAALQKALSTVVPATFNQISVDGDTSTNDTVLLPPACPARKSLTVRPTMIRLLLR